MTVRMPLCHALPILLAGAPAEKPSTAAYDIFRAPVKFDNLRWIRDSDRHTPGAYQVDKKTWFFAPRNPHDIYNSTLFLGSELPVPDQHCKQMRMIGLLPRPVQLHDSTRSRQIYYEGLLQDGQGRRSLLRVERLGLTPDQWCFSRLVHATDFKEHELADHEKSDHLPSFILGFGVRMYTFPVELFVRPEVPTDEDLAELMASAHFFVSDREAIDDFLAGSEVKKPRG